MDLRMPDDPVDREFPPKLTDALREVYRPPVSVPPERDAAILARARLRLGRRRRVRWAWPASAAALLLVGVALSTRMTGVRRGPELEQPAPEVARGVAAAVPAREDVDGDGRVDILDAFTLARRIERGGVEDSKFDMTGDGRTDRKDVDAVAVAAVRLRR